MYVYVYILEWILFNDVTCWTSCKSLRDNLVILFHINKFDSIAFLKLNFCTLCMLILTFKKILLLNFRLFFILNFFYSTLGFILHLLFKLD